MLAQLALALCLAQTPDVLVIVLDDVGETERVLLPSLDAVAARGVTFQRFYSFPVCSPTRYAALAGRYPRREGIGDVINAHNSATGASPAPDRLDVMLPESLKPTHKTGLFGKWHLGRASEGERVDLLDVTESGPFVSGFDYWRAGNPNSIAQPGSTKDGYYNWYRVDDGTVSRFHSTYATAAQRDAFVSWWTGTSGPRFAWLAFSAAHQPYDTPPGYAPASTTRGAYELVIEYLDDALTAVLGTVNLDTTFVFVFGDNGTPDDARPVGAPSGYWKGTCYEGGVNVPLLVSVPGVSSGATSQRLVSALDIAPTVCELLGVQPMRGYEDGRSFANSLGANWSGTTARTWLAVERYDTPPGNGQIEGYDDLAVIECAWKLRRVDADGIGPGGYAESAYYLPNDPFEQNPFDPNLLPTGLRTRLYAQLASLPPRLP